MEYTRSFLSFRSIVRLDFARVMAAERVLALSSVISTTTLPFSTSASTHMGAPQLCEMIYTFSVALGSSTLPVKRPAASAKILKTASPLME